MSHISAQFLMVSFFIYWWPGSQNLLLRSTANRVSSASVYFCRQFFGVWAFVNWPRGFRALWGRVMNASGASARALQYGRLRFVAAIKTHDDMLFAANRVSSVYFCRRFLGVGASSKLAARFPDLRDV